MIRTYAELLKLPTFEERFNYLKLNGQVCKETFGFDRYLNQVFYRSKQWRKIRNQIILRDEGRDLGVEGYEIPDRIYIHHMNPLTKDDIIHSSDFLLNPDYLICVSHATHEAIHYGDINLLPRQLIERTPNDTTLW